MRTQLAYLEPSIVGGAKYYPCSAYVSTGQLINCVYLVEKDGYFARWGGWPEDDSAKHYLHLNEISSIADSPNRLPAQFAKEVYNIGESGMGIYSFSIRFKNGMKQAYSSGGAVDFINYPKNTSGSDIVKILPYTTTNSEPLKEPTYYWCLYSD